MKNDLKTTVIVVLFIIVGIQAFLLLQRGKPSVKPVIVVRQEQVRTVPVQAPAPVRMAKKHPAGSAGKIAFVLDDWGYSMHNCKYLRDIHAPLAVSVLPNLRYSDEIAKCAASSGEVVMLHLPLQPYQNNDRYPDNYLITTTMKPALVSKLLEDTLAKMPLVQGVNNHMGSKATEDKSLMKLIFQHLKKHRLFFVDSMTSPHHSICEETAADMRLPFAQRDVFLDNINTKDEIEKQITALAQKARRKGSAIAIGHDRELTMRVLKEEIPLLQAEGFEIVRVTDLLKDQ